MRKEMTRDDVCIHDEGEKGKREWRDTDEKGSEAGMRKREIRK